MNFASVVNLLASPAAVQCDFLAPIPQNASAPDYTRDNNVSRMLLLYSRSCMVNEGDGGTEGVENWLRRTELPQAVIDDRDHHVWTANRYLGTAIDMIEELDCDFLYSMHGLRSGDPWQLVRHLATSVLDASGWQRELKHQSFQHLWESLGDGVVECRR